MEIKVCVVIYKDALICKVETGISMTLFVCVCVCVCVCVYVFGFESYISKSLTLGSDRVKLCFRPILRHTQTNTHTCTHTVHTLTCILRPTQMLTSTLPFIHTVSCLVR